MNTTNTDSGDYQLQFISDYVKFSFTKHFNVSVHGVSADEREEMKRKSVKEGESVTLDPGATKNPNDVMKWYFNETLITEITGDQSKIGTYHLNIRNTTNTHSGEYKLQINSIRFTIMRSFSVSVTAVPGSVLSSAALPLIISAVLLIFVAVVAVVAAVIYCRKRKRRKNSRRKHNHNEQTDLCLMTTTSENSARETSS